MPDSNPRASIQTADSLREAREARADRSSSSSAELREATLLEVKNQVSAQDIEYVRRAIKVLGSQKLNELDYPLQPTTEVLRAHGETVSLHLRWTLDKPTTGAAKILANRESRLDDLEKQILKDYKDATPETPRKASVIKSFLKGSSIGSSRRDSQSTGKSVKTKSLFSLRKEEQTQSSTETFAPKSQEYEKHKEDVERHLFKNLGMAKFYELRLPSTQDKNDLLRDLVARHRELQKAETPLSIEAKQKDFETIETLHKTNSATTELLQAKYSSYLAQFPEGESEKKARAFLSEDLRDSFWSIKPGERLSAENKLMSQELPQPIKGPSRVERQRDKYLNASEVLPDVIENPNLKLDKASILKLVKNTLTIAEYKPPGVGQQAVSDQMVKEARELLILIENKKPGLIHNAIHSPTVGRKMDKRTADKEFLVGIQNSLQKARRGGFSQSTPSTPRAPQNIGRIP